MAKLHHRFQQPDDAAPDQDILPLDTLCTILTRQSTQGQRERNTFSAEVDPSILISEAERLGFPRERIRVLDWDMGKGAYNTTIEQRPALLHWLTELLPSGKSRVVLVSQEDRLFRDRTEIQVNRFIEEVTRLRGWVVCGSRIYNFRREMDKEHFRLACKYGKQYIEFHIKGRLHPAIQRAAMEGRYTGGIVPWGYRVDYDAASSTFKHLLRYEPHATLVIEEVFGRFARMERPTVTELVRSWWRDGLVWPFFRPEVDARQVHWRDQKCHRDEERGGYLFVPRQAQTILTNPLYLGWMVRKGDVARDAATNQPRVSHEPLIDADLFWWCYDHILGQRPSYAPPRIGPAVAVEHPRRSITRAPDEVMFLAQGLIKCAQHGKRMSQFEQRDQSRGTFRRGYVRCWLLNTEHRERVEQSGSDCPVVPIPAVEEAICHSFTEHLRLDDRDDLAITQVLAKVAQRRAESGTGQVAELERQITQQREAFERAKRLAYAAPDLESEVVEDMRRAKRMIAELESRASEVRARVEPTDRSWIMAERAVSLAARIRETFADWSRQAQARVIGLALESAVLGRVDQHNVGLWMRWQGGVVARASIIQPKGHLRYWTEDEDAALRANYHRLTHEALERMFPDRSHDAIIHRARDLRLSRPRPGPFLTEAPLVVHSPPTSNEMASYGFPLSAPEDIAPACSERGHFALCFATRLLRRSPDSACRHPPARPNCARCRNW